MNIEGAANFLVGSLLMGLGVIVIALVIILLNNLFSKYWKPFSWGLFSQPIMFQDTHEKLDSKLNESEVKQK